MLIAEPKLPPKWVLHYYIRFHKSLINVSNKLCIIPFNQCLHDITKTFERINSELGLNLNTRSIHDSEIEIIHNHITDYNDLVKQRDTLKAIPCAERNIKKAKTNEIIRSQPKFHKAVSVYEQIGALVKYEIQE
tara:strand:+ start:8796 stop:9197 length:402 start_codon:yes stop_codon:yes gene_type:complete